MTDAMPVICRRCGFGNVPGDQFCGSCGAFLEWEGESARPEPAASTPAPGSAAPDWAGAGPTAGAAADAAELATVAWTPPAEPEAAPAADAGLLRCPACGIANAASRTFCQSCGATLSAAARHSEPSAAQLAAAIQAVPVAATSPVPPAPPGMAGTREEAPKSRGVPGWLFALVAAGVLVGVVVVVASQLLKGEGPSTGASAAPSLAGGSAGPGASGSGAPGASSSPGGSGVPAEPANLALTAATASSVVGDRAKFQPGMAIDGDIRTAWQEGSSTEKGQWIEVAFAPSRADSLVIRNGYQASNALYTGNRRLKDVLISVNGGEPIAVRLKDAKKAQTIALGGVSGATSVRITIVSTYPARKTAANGSPFDDAALSEISVIGVAGG